jgi:hypothetical protein
MSEKDNKRIRASALFVLSQRGKGKPLFEIREQSSHGITSSYSAENHRDRVVGSNTGTLKSSCHLPTGSSLIKAGESLKCHREMLRIAMIQNENLY